MRACVAVLSALALAGWTDQREPSIREMIGAARTAMGAGDYVRARELYERLAEALPESPAVPYNLGVAHYLAGEPERAAEEFRRALEMARDPALRAKSLFNLGNAAYAQSLAALQGQGDMQQAAGQLEGAAGKLEEAIDHFKEAIGVDPTDEDARANAELAHRLLKELRRLEEQMKQQQQQQQQEQEQEQEQQQQEQEQEQEQHQQQEQQQSGEQEQQEQQEQPQAAAPDEEQQPSGAQQGAFRSQQDQALEEPKKQGPPKPQRMSREEAERLLQLVRDRERQRREELARREAAQHPPVDRDW